MDLHKLNRYQVNIVMLKLFWVFFFFNIAIELVFGGSVRFELGILLFAELVILWLAMYLLVKRNQVSTGEAGGLDKVLHELNIVYWSYEPEKNEYYISPGIEQIMGYRAENLMKDSGMFLKQVHPYDLFRVREAEKDLMAGKRSMIEYRVTKPGGETRWIQNMAVPLKDQDGQVYRLEGLIVDVSRQKELEEQMTQMALSDALTGLPNRRMFEKYFTHFAGRSQYVDQQLAILFIDLDSFKAVNDTLGHEMGDQLLIEVTVRLKKIFRGTDFLSRLGGDEFVALLTRISQDSVIAVNERILEALSQPFEIDGQSVTIGASIGISIYPHDGEELEDLIRKADQAMYEAKNKGKKTYRFYRPS